MKNKVLIIVLSLGHGLNDCIAGYFLGRLVHLKLDLMQISIGLFLYNLLAFGGQYPAALLLERTGRPKEFLRIAYGLNVGAVALFIVSPQLSIILAGIASAMYHVAGGSVCARENKALNIGLFAAPGVAGLILGGWLAYQGIDCVIILLVAAIGFFLVISRLPIPNRARIQNELSSATKSFSLEQHDLIMIGLLTVISLRSAIWNVFQLIQENNYEWLIAIALSAFVGKIAGGWIADRVGWRLYALVSLIAATPLITLCRNEIILFCIGIGLLQSGIPATTSLLIRSMNGKTERAIGLSFGTAIIIGAFVFYTGKTSFLLSNYALAAFVLAMLIILYVSGRRKRPGFLQ